jgi:hypothetical protein
MIPNGYMTFNFELYNFGIGWSQWEFPWERRYRKGEKDIPTEIEEERISGIPVYFGLRASGRLRERVNCRTPLSCTAIVATCYLDCCDASSSRRPADGYSTE